MAKKDFYRSLLRLIAPSKLKRIAMDNFTRMSGPYSNEDYVERCSTSSRFWRIVDELTLAELRPLAKQLGIQTKGADRESLLDSILAVESGSLNTSSAKPGGKATGPGSSTYALLEKGVGYEKLLPHLTSQRSKNGSLTKGEQIIWGAMGASFAANVRGGGPEEVFVRCSDAWPKIVLDSLRIIGAKKTEILLKKTFETLFPSASLSLTGKDLMRAANRASKDNPAVRKEWRVLVSSTNEDVDSLARTFLLANPDLF